eukprot:364280-Chlamydomonas_euryale.AAC.12
MVVPQCKWRRTCQQCSPHTACAVCHNAEEGEAGKSASAQSTPAVCGSGRLVQHNASVPVCWRLSVQCMASVPGARGCRCSAAPRCLGLGALRAAQCVAVCEHMRDAFARRPLYLRLQFRHAWDAYACPTLATTECRSNERTSSATCIYEASHARTR